LEYLDAEARPWFDADPAGGAPERESATPGTMSETPSVAALIRPNPPSAMAHRQRKDYYEIP
jgi:hypothetical protein